MLNNVQNNQPAFTSTVRMTQKTAKALHLQPQEIQRAVMEDVRAISRNGRNDVVNVFFTEHLSRNVRPEFRHLYLDKILKMDILEQRGSKYFASEAEKVIKPHEPEYNKLDVMGLYKSTRAKMQPYDTPSNRFMQYV